MVQCSTTTAPQKRENVNISKSKSKLDNTLICTAMHCSL